jgi:hypothetical protein
VALSKPVTIISTLGSWGGVFAATTVLLPSMSIQQKAKLITELFLFITFLSSRLSGLTINEVIDAKIIYF